jgi:hypothetical protein
VPEQYLPDVPEAEELFALTLARKCPDGDAHCKQFNDSQFAPDDLGE